MDADLRTLRATKGENVSALRRALHALDLQGESPTLVSRVRIAAFNWLRIVFGLVLLYDSWNSLGWSNQTEINRVLTPAPTSDWYSITVAAEPFVKFGLAMSLLAGRGLRVMGWVGVLFGLVAWLAVEGGGDFGPDATDPGLGLPYVVLFLYVLGVERLSRPRDASANELLALARVTFGLLWAYDALLRLEPYFLGHYLDYLVSAHKETAGTWRGAYDQTWIAISQAIGPQLAAAGVGLVEAAIAVSLVSGRGLRIMGPIGLALSFIVWSAAGERAGAHSVGSTELIPMRLFGAAITYMLVLGYVWVLYNPLDLLRVSHEARMAKRARDIWRS